MADDYYRPGYLGHPIGNYPGMSPEQYRQFNNGRRQAEEEAQQAAQRRQQEQQRQQDAERQRQEDARRAQQQQQQRWEQQRQQDHDQRSRLQAASSEQRSSPSAVPAPAFPPTRTYGARSQGHTGVIATEHAQTGAGSRFLTVVGKAIGAVVILFIALLVIAAASSSNTPQTRESQSPVSTNTVVSGAPIPPGSLEPNAPQATPPAASEPADPGREGEGTEEGGLATGESAGSEGEATVPSEQAPVLRHFVPPSGAPELRITIPGNPNGRFPCFVHFFGERTAARWPANPAEAYPYSQTLRVSLACTQDDIVCYGAWRSDWGYFWGVGFDNAPAMQNPTNCRVCGPGVTSWELPRLADQ